MKAGCWTYASASCVGSSHVKRGEMCQDYCQITSSWIGHHSEGTYLFAAVADGAGTASHSAEGSKLAIELLRKDVHRMVFRNRLELNEGLLRSAAKNVRRKIRETAMRNHLSGSDYATTLICVILVRDAAWHLQVGDGAVVFRHGATRSVGHWPAKGKYANETFFITDAELSPHLHVQQVPLPDEFTLMTDGLERLALNFNTQQPCDPFFESFYRQLRHRGAGPQEDLSEQLYHWMQSPSVSERTDDDQSLVLVTKQLHGRDTPG